MSNSLKYFCICMKTEKPEKPTANPVNVAPYKPPVPAPLITPEENSNDTMKISLNIGKTDEAILPATRKNTIKPVTVRQDEAASVTALQNAGTAFGGGKAALPMRDE